MATTPTERLFTTSEASSPGGIPVVLDQPFRLWSRAVYVGVSGSVVAEMADGSVLTFVGVQAGTTLPIRANKIVAAGTTAASMLALF